MALGRLILSLVKLIAASLVVGVVMTHFDLSAADLLARIGVTPQRIVEALQQGYEWAVPHVMLGAMIVLPVWVVLSILRPPR